MNEWFTVILGGDNDAIVKSIPGKGIISMRSEEQIQEIYNWLVELWDTNRLGPWKRYGRKYKFRREEDAMAFKLRWS